MPSKFGYIESGRLDKEGTTLCFGCCYCTHRQRRIACTCLWTPIVLFVCFVIAVLIRTAFIEDKFELKKLTDAEPVFINPDESLKLEWAKRLGQAIQIRSISYNDSTLSLDEILELHTFIQDNYPNIHSADYISRTVVNGHSLIYRVEGTVHTKNPYMLCAHLDVVPEGKVESWSHDPFLGDIVHDDEADKDFIFGRGAIDDKQSVLGILEALEHLVKNGERPKRTFYIAFGHDEEVSGFQGASNIAKELEATFERNNEKLDFILDEGMFVMKGIFPGLDDPIVYVGVVEKGWAAVEISVEGVQGHASKPPRESAIGILAKAVAALEEDRQPSMFGESVEIDSFEYLAPHANFLYKTIFGNMWLFKGILSSILSDDPASDALQRTTTAVTIFEGGVKLNVIPSEARAFINYRIHPAQTIDSVVEYLRDVIDDDRVVINVVESFVPSKVSDYTNDAMPFQTVVNSAVEVYPEGHVTPGIMIANTDTRHYQHLTDTTFRFSPTFLMKSDLDRFHGLNERISVDNYAQVIEFFHRLMINADYNVIEKSELEIPASFEGSGVTDDADAIENVAVVDENFEVAQDQDKEAEGSSEF